VPFYLRGIEFTAQLDDFVRCIRSGEPPRCSFADAAATIRVVEQLFSNHTAITGGLN
jgi:predicted dehydrogenase